MVPRQSPLARVAIWDVRLVVNETALSNLTRAFPIIPCSAVIARGATWTPSAGAPTSPCPGADSSRAAPQQPWNGRWDT
eukprot:7938559-Lingulodinium_polyedra.AAC.1